MNATLKTFGYPQSLIVESDHWAVVLRPVQVTLGSLVLISKSDATRFPELSAEDLKDLGRISGAMESALRQAFGHDKINYLMLMMVDPHVHYHVLPRYGRPVSFQGQDFEDHSWPGPPDLGRHLAVDDETMTAIGAAIRQYL